MAWSWSHSPDAYVNAQKNLSRLPLHIIREIYAEWKAWDRARRRDPDDAELACTHAKQHALSDPMQVQVETI